MQRPAHLKLVDDMLYHSCLVCVRLPEGSGTSEATTFIPPVSELLVICSNDAYTLITLDPLMGGCR